MQDDASRFLETGERAYRNGAFERASQDLTAATHANPRNARAWLMLGLVQRDLGELDVAAGTLDRALELSPKDAHLLLVRARIELERGGAAAAWFSRARDVSPDNPQVVLGLAAALHQEGVSREAVALLQHTTALYPDWLEGLQTLARLRWQLGDGAHATDDYLAAIRRQPTKPLLWASYLGTLSRMLGHHVLLEQLPTARATAGSNILFDMLEATALSEAGDAARADAQFARIETTRDIAFGLSRLRHFLRTNRVAEAAAFADTLLGQPGDMAVWPYLGTAWRLLGDPRWDWLEGDPRLVSIIDLTELGPTLEPLAAVLRRLHRSTTHPFEQSPRGGTQTDGPLFSRSEPEICGLRAIVTSAIERHVAQLPPPDPRHPMLSRPRSGIRIMGSWSVRLTGQGFHVNHVHPHGWISAALYISLPAGLTDNEGWLALGQPPAELGLDLPPTRLIEPAPARLVLFPSIMWHGTLPFADGERLTVAFDAAPRSPPG